LFRSPLDRRCHPVGTFRHVTAVGSRGGVTWWGHGAVPVRAVPAPVIADGPATATEPTHDSAPTTRTVGGALTDAERLRRISLPELLPLVRRSGLVGVLEEVARTVHVDRDARAH